MPPFQESPRCLSPFQRILLSLHCFDFHGEDRGGRGEDRGGMGESPVGKPRLKASRESHRSLDPREGKGDTTATAQYESTRACLHSRRGLTPLGRLHKYPKIHVSTGEESSGSGNHSTQDLRPRHRRERNQERPSSNSHGYGPFLRPPEWVTEVPLVSPEHLPQLEKIQVVLPSK